MHAGNKSDKKKHAKTSVQFSCSFLLLAFTSDEKLQKLTRLRVLVLTFLTFFLTTNVGGDVISFGTFLEKNNFDQL